MTARKIRVLYILGSGFSGSTLLGAFLGSHEKIFNLGEVKNYIQDLSAKNTACSCGQNMTECPFCPALLGNKYYPYLYLPLTERIKATVNTIIGREHPQSSVECKETQRLQEIFLQARSVAP